MKLPPVPSFPGKVGTTPANALKVADPLKPKMVGFSGKMSKGKVAITHHMSNGGSLPAFSFHDPELAAKHIRKALNHEWQHPEKNESAPINEAINTPPVV